MTMAKAKAAASKKAAPKKAPAAKKAAPAKEAAPTFKYGVSELAEKLNIKPASVRVALRKAGVEKAGRSYGWNTQAELKAVTDQLKSASTEDSAE